MWTSNDSQHPPTQNPASSPTPANLRTPAFLGPGLKIKGEITGNEDLRLDSKFEGSISIGGFRLTVGPNSQVDGEIKAREVVVSGKVTGNINARDRLEIKKGSSVVGDMSTARIMIEEGAYFKGAIEIDSSNTQVGADLDTLLSKAK
ncbi:MAG: polymer-forming cytoskeletal protein [Candidatus Acidiferrales bacterium]|jgi:cytoskeletal protein CcmA (bactofilin family)